MQIAIVNKGLSLPVFKLRTNNDVSCCRLSQYCLISSSLIRPTLFITPLAMSRSGLSHYLMCDLLFLSTGLKNSKLALLEGCSRNPTPDCSSAHAHWVMDSDPYSVYNIPRII